ncbi:sulfurtransferase [Mycobacterium sp. EPG1]|nr:sulfurtransferase [Mycobacterium sp. EPG1]
MVNNIPPAVSMRQPPPHPERTPNMTSAPSIPTTVNCHDLDQLLNSDAALRVIDVRTPGEFETAHIAGSYNVPLDLLREHRDEIVKHLDQQVVLVCRSGQRAGQAEATLREAGLCNVHILDGGITAWEAKGFAVNRGTQRWDLERQVRLVAGSIVLTSILGSIAVPKLKWLAGAVGGGLTFAAVSNTCAMGTLLGKLPYNRGNACDAQNVVAQLVQR